MYQILKRSKYYLYNFNKEKVGTHQDTLRGQLFSIEIYRSKNVTKLQIIHLLYESTKVVKFVIRRKNDQTRMKSRTPMTENGLKVHHLLYDLRIDLFHLC